MYGLVRINGILTISMGLLLIGFGIAIAIVGVNQNEQLLAIVNATLMSGTGYVLLDTRYYTLPIAAILFLIGLGISSNGQLMISIADNASNTRKILDLLKDALNKEKPAVINTINVNTDETKNQDATVVVNSSEDKG